MAPKVGAKLDPALVAAGFDKNRNGQVSDDLKIDAPIDSDGNGQVAVAELAAAIGRDQVVISGNAVAAKQPALPADLPEIRTLESIRQISSGGLGLFGMYYPGWQYERTRTRSDGSTYTDYDWAAACSELRAKLSSVQAVARHSEGARAKAIDRAAGSAIASHTFGAVLDILFDTRAGRSDYQALRAALNNIHEMAATPAQPAVTVDRVNGAVGTAQSAIGGLRQAAGNPGSKSAEAEVQAKAADLRQKAQNIPVWQFILIFGFFRKMSFNNQAKRLEEQLAVLKAANPDALTQRAADLARQAYEVGRQAGAARSVDDGFALENSSKPIIAGADGVRKDAQAQAEKINALFKTLSG
ncbi:MAG: hypothetical protein FJZ00_08355 [Candidatus Sericytochromatia bacterium]|uniref:EF-hand domain-containing protein n=1 Tax=Candidatus Tanganyikabacteria bacterium TaxID=2961651 RepID=A0A937X5H3_9BACT|nr:hypothetical protein [Candidatus Tanganyikabacteria bacterium]